MEGNHIHHCICVTLFRLLGVKCAYVHVLIGGYVTGLGCFFFFCNHDVVGSGPDYTNHHRGKSNGKIRGKQT